jgi:beta-phosphoglucomutase-like phosphatase (HAD superfamily)
MPAGAPKLPGPRAIIFDLDEVLLDSSKAWQYAVEESIASVCARRIDAGPLAEEYRRRPLRHALAVLIDDPAQRDRCEQLSREILYRGAMKRLLVHDGISMALDRLRARQIEAGAISREPHAIALKQIQSTGLDRFLSILAATPEDEPWDPGERFAHCLSFLGYDASACVYISAEPADLEAIKRTGCICFAPGWLKPVPDHPIIPSPANIFPATSGGLDSQAADSGSTRA